MMTQIWWLKYDDSNILNKK